MEGLIYVFAGWEKNEPLIGTLEVTHTRGRENTAFIYDESWIENHPSLILDPELQAFSGRQYPDMNKKLFGFLSDSAPDRWGRKLMERREIIQAKKENRNIRKLYEADYLIGVHDGGRVGGLRFKLDPEGVFLSDEQSLAAPPMTELRKLEQASLKYETGKDPYDEKWFRELIQPGSSLGGARPKANVTDPSGNIWIAKFPSKHDARNIGAWEMTAHDLALLCGIQVPEAKIMHLSEAGDTFLVQRFDREAGNDKLHRIHFASAMTMLGETDGTQNPVSYLDIADVLERIGANPQEDLRELWRRIAFNVAISNADDHLRNHGFLLFEDGWRLSPAYDLNPVYDAEYLSLNLNLDDNSRDMALVLSVADYFRYTKVEAELQLQKIRTTVKENWRRIAAKYHISNSEQDMMRQAFSECE